MSVWKGLRRSALVLCLSLRLMNISCRRECRLTSNTRTSLPAWFRSYKIWYQNRLFLCDSWRRDGRRAEIKNVPRMWERKVQRRDYILELLFLHDRTIQLESRLTVQKNTASSLNGRLRVCLHRHLMMAGFVYRNLLLVFITLKGIHFSFLMNYLYVKTQIFKKGN